MYISHRDVEHSFRSQKKLTTGSVEVSFGASTVFMQCSLSGVADTPSG